MSDNDKPQTEEEYVVWAKENDCGDFSDAVKRQYDNNLTVAASAVTNHPFFVELNQFLHNFAKEHFTKESSHLLMAPEGSPFGLKRKSYSSALDKVYRLNVVRNNNFPNEPKGGWVTPDNWFSLLDDILRGTIACKYIDGPGILSQLLVESLRVSFPEACFVTGFVRKRPEALS